MSLGILYGHLCGLFGNPQGGEFRRPFLGIFSRPLTQRAHLQMLPPSPSSSPFVNFVSFVAYSPPPPFCALRAFLWLTIFTSPSPLPAPPDRICKTQIRVHLCSFVVTSSLRASAPLREPPLRFLLKSESVPFVKSVAGCPDPTRPTGASANAAPHSLFFPFREFRVFRGYPLPPDPNPYHPYNP